MKIYHSIQSHLILSMVQFEQNDISKSSTLE